ncbi:MAG: YdcF family protein [Clostridium sp.]
MKRVFKWISLLILIVLVVMIYTAYNIYSFANNPVVKSDAIMVLGCRVKGQTPSVSLERRMQTALELYENGYGEKLILSGGMGAGEDISEAEAMRRFYVNKGINEKNIIIEDKSTSTYENFKFSKKYISENNIESIIVVSNGYHLKRASKVAGNLGISATYKGFVLKDYMVIEIKGIIREILATYKYNILGK